MSKRILVTGGGGFIGSALARRLDEQHHEVTVLDDFSRGHRERLVGVRAEILSADIRNPIAVRQAVQSAQVIFHLAYVQGTQTFYEQPKKVVDVALRGMMNLLEACEFWRESGMAGKELILVSSSEVYQVPPEGFFPTGEDVPLSVPDVTNPRYSYGAGKIACEVAALAYAHAGALDRTVIVRPHNVYGPDMGHEHVIPQLIEKLAAMEHPCKLHIQGTGLETRSFCHISDCVEGFLFLLELGQDKTIYHLGSDEDEVAIGDLAHMLARHLGFEDDEWELVSSELPKGSPPRRLPDISRLRDLGYEPLVSLGSGLRGVCRWYAPGKAA